VRVGDKVLSSRAEMNKTLVTGLWKKDGKLNPDVQFMGLGGWGTMVVVTDCSGE
jgi:hypothetical protein